MVFAAIKIDSWAENNEFCVTGKDANSQIVFGVKDGNPNSQQGSTNSGK